MMPDWGPILGLTCSKRMERLRDPETRRFMEDRAASPDAGVFARLTGWDTYVIGDTFSDENEGLTGDSVGDIAAERGQGSVRHAARHRARRRPAHRAVARCHRRRPRVLGAAAPGVGPPVGDARRLRRRCAPGPHAGRRTTPPGSSPTASAAASSRSVGARGADDDPGPRRAVRSARPRRDPRGRPRRPGAVRPGDRRLASCSTMVDDLPGGTSRLLRRVGRRAQRVGQRRRDRARRPTDRRHCPGRSSAPAPTPTPSPPAEAPAPATGSVRTAASVARRQSDLGAPEPGREQGEQQQAPAPPARSARCRCPGW